MNALKVEIRNLEPMSVACTRAVGASPEPEAWEQLRSWAEPLGLLEDLDAHPVFGFNNPGPEPGSTGYGYEVWIAVAPGTTAPAGDITVADFPGGLYAVTRCRLLGDPGVTATWKLLAAWVEDARGYSRRHTHELEKILNPLAPPEQMELELHLPVTRER